MRVLLVEDDEAIGESLQALLKDEYYTVDWSTTGEQALDAGLGEDYDLIILDIGLPDMTGLEVCNTLREEGVITPVLMLTARDTTKDTIAGLDSGADDYVVKPFDVDELMARVRALIRRKSANKVPVLSLGSISLDPASKMVMREGKEIALSSREFALLEYMMRHANQIISKQTLLEHIWGEEVDAFSNVVDVYIGYLRKKIDKAFPQLPPLLETLKGRGYRLSHNLSD